jgi:DNA-binding CsgD family transcriptional regulator
MSSTEGNDVAKNTQMEDVVSEYSEVIGYASEVRKNVIQQIDEISNFDNPKDYLRKICLDLRTRLAVDRVAITYVNLDSQVTKVLVHSLNPNAPQQTDGLGFYPLSRWKKLYEFEKLVDAEKIVRLDDRVSKMQFSVSDLENYREELDLPSGGYKPFSGRACITTPMLVGDMGSVLTCCNYQNPRKWTDRERTEITQLTTNISAMLSKHFQLEEVQSSVKEILGTDELNDLFTARERGILALLSEGLANKEIALQVGITVATVEAHISKMFRKTHFTRRTDLAFLHKKITARDQILRATK